jgi:dienelactone hydrolase
LKTDYKPKGNKVPLSDTYVYRIGSGKKVVVIMGDIFGVASGRNQSLADTFADLGYNVYMP